MVGAASSDMSVSLPEAQFVSANHLTDGEVS